MGLYFKSVRVMKEITKKEICEYCNISMQYLTKIEDDLSFTSISSETKNNICSSLDIKLNYDISIYKSFTDNMNLFIKKCIYCDEKEAKEIFLSLERKESTIINSIFYPDYILMSFIYIVLFDSDNVDLLKIIRFLDRNIMHFDRHQQQLYYLYLAVYNKNIDKLIAAENILIDTLTISGDEQIISMINYHLGIVCNKLGKNLEALLYNTKAKNLFANYNNYTRSAQCASHMGLICLNLKEYKEAFKLCNEAIELAEEMNDNTILAANYQNLSWIDLLTKKYDNILTFVKKSFSYGRDDAVLFFHASYALMKLGDAENSMKWIENGVKNIKNHKSIVYKLLVLVKKINLNPKNAEKYFEEIIDFTSKNPQHDIDLLHLLYTELIECKKKSGKFEEALKYYEILEKI